MGSTRRKPAPEPDPPRRGKPATTPEGRENQLISLAVSLTEKQLREGTASSQVITHYLKLGSSRERLEQERLKRENELLEARVDQIKTAKRMESVYEAALRAMREYSGQDPEDDDGNTSG